MSGGFPDPDVRIVRQAGRYHVQAGQPHDAWATICVRERRDAALGVRDAVRKVMANHRDDRYTDDIVEEDDDVQTDEPGIVYKECTCDQKTQKIPLAHHESCPIRARHPGPFPPGDTPDSMSSNTVLDDIEEEAQG